MSLFAFKDEGGNDVDLRLTDEVGEALEFGDTIERGGKTYTRCPIRRDPGVRLFFKPISGVTIARSLPKHYPGGDFYLKDGTVGFNNDHSKRDFCAHSADNHEEPVHMLDDII